MRRRFKKIKIKQKQNDWQGVYITSLPRISQNYWVDILWLLLKLLHSDLTALEENFCIKNVPTYIGTLVYTMFYDVCPLGWVYLISNFMNKPFKETRMLISTDRFLV